MFRNLKFLFFLSIFFFHVIGSAYKPQLRFNHITSKDGLSHSWVTHIYKDSYGYMWFVTEGNGLNKFNGHDFTVYKHNPKNSKSLTDNLVTFIYEDKKRNLWIGTQYGLNIYDRELDKFKPYANLYDRYVGGMCEMDNGKFYVTTVHDLIILDRETKSVDFIIEENDNLPYTFSEDAMLKYTKDRLLIGTTEGLFSIESTTNNITSILKDISVKSLYKDTKGNIWIGTERNGLFCMSYSKNDSAKPSFKNYKHDPNNENSISNSVILEIQEDNNGFLWIAAENDGINLLDLNSLNTKKPKFYHYRGSPSNKFSLSSNSLQDIYIDNNQNTVWIGTFNSGIDYYNKIMYKFNYVKNTPDNSNSLSNNNVHVFYEEGENLWIGTSEGLNIYNRRNNKWQQFNHEENNSKSIGARGVYAIFRDSRKNMWIGTWGGGLNLFNENKKTFARFLHDKNKEGSISSNNIFDITEDEQETLWIATMGGGINKFNYKTKTFEKYESNNKDNTNAINDWVTQIVESNNGEIWFATYYGAYLIGKEKDEFMHFRHLEDDSRSISSNSVVIIFEDSKHNL